MIFTASSTAAVDAKSKRRHTAVSSSEQTLHSYGIAPLSKAATVTTTYVRPEDFEAALKKHPMDTNAGTVTCQYIDRAASLVFHSPTLRLTVDAFEPVELLRTAPSPWRPTRERTIRFSELPATTMLQVINVGGARCIEPLSGVLNSTDTALGISRLVESKFDDAAASAQQEWFEDGTESGFSRTLSTLVHMYGDALVSMVESFLGSPTANTEVAVEAAQWLGEVDHPATRQYRKSLLEKVLLTSPATRLRHGAASGLAAMNDPSSLAAVLEATDRESNSRLRRFLKLVVDQLERTRACRSS